MRPTLQTEGVSEAPPALAQALAPPPAQPDGGPVCEPQPDPRQPATQTEPLGPVRLGSPTQKPLPRQPVYQLSPLRRQPPTKADQSPTKGLRGPRPKLLRPRPNVFVSPQELRQQLQARLPSLADPALPGAGGPTQPDAPRRSNSGLGLEPTSPSTSPSKCGGSSPSLGSFRDRPGAAGPPAAGSCGVRPSTSDPLSPGAARDSRSPPRRGVSSASAAPDPGPLGPAEALSPPRHHNSLRSTSAADLSLRLRRLSGVDPLSSLRRQSSAAPHWVLHEAAFRRPDTPELLFHVPRRDTRGSSPVASLSPLTAPPRSPAALGGACGPGPNAADGTAAADPAPMAGGGEAGRPGTDAATGWGAVRRASDVEAGGRPNRSPLVNRSRQL